MKLLISAMILASCAHMDFDTNYSADTAKRFHCQPLTNTKAVNDLSNYDESKLPELEKHTGYSKCKIAVRSEETVIIECLQPTLYKQIVTKKPAQCDKFMKENGL